jgi:Kef-type K+ transport system membrane component KefB
MLLSTPPEDPTRFFPLLIVLILAFIVPIILARLRGVPVVVGEILAGVIVGPSVLGWVTDGPILTFMADIGLAFLMFLAGMEIDFEMLLGGTRQTREKPGEPNVGKIALVIYAITFALAIPGALLLKEVGLQGDTWLLIFILSATSLGVLLPILKERNMLSSRYGQTIFVSAMIADFVTVILLTIYLIIGDRGFDPEVFSLGLLGLAFLLFYRFGPKFIRIPTVRNFFEELSSATTQLILGAFLAGMIISLIKDAQDDSIVHKLEAFGFGFFIPVFFILVGVDLDIQSLLASPESLLTLPEFFGIALVVKLVPMLFMRKFFSWREIFGGGLLLNTHLSLEVAVAVIGLRAGLFDPATATTVILFSVITVLTMPFLFGAILPYKPTLLERYTVIFGASKLGLSVAQELRAHGDDVRFIEDDPTWLAKLEEEGMQALPIPAQPERIHDIPIKEISAFLTVNDDEKLNLEVSQHARSHGVENVIAMIREPDLLPDAQEAGIQPYTPAIQRATMLAMMARNPDVLTLLTSTSDNRDTIELWVRNRNLNNTQVRNLNLPGDTIILALRRDGELIIPRGNTHILCNDRLTLTGNLDDLDEIRNKLEREGIGD